MVDPWWCEQYRLPEGAKMHRVVFSPLGQVVFRCYSRAEAIEATRALNVISRLPAGSQFLACSVLQLELGSQFKPEITNDPPETAEPRGERLS